MSFELVGEFSGLPMPLVRSKINEALGTIYDEQLWSWQIREAGWLTGGLLFGAGTQSQGTITATALGTTIVGDATAAALWAAYQTAGTLPLLTQCQIRSPLYSLYNIVAFNGTNTFTIDRPWTEPPGSGLTYMLYQAYFAAPVADFKRFIAIRDTKNAAPLDYWSFNQTDLQVRDPQRMNFNLPAYAVPYEVDNRTGSATLGYMLYELWPHPLSVWPYTIAYLRRGALLSLPADTVPVPLTEKLVKYKAREAICLWREAQKGDNLQRGSGADWKFLAQAAAAEYAREKKIIADRDRDMVALYWNRFVRDAAIGYWGQPFASIGGTLNVGRLE